MNAKEAFEMFRLSDSLWEATKWKHPVRWALWEAVKFEAARSESAEIAELKATVETFRRSLSGSKDSFPF